MDGINGLVYHLGYVKEETVSPRGFKMEGL